MIENVSKPLTVAYEDFKTTMVNAVNNSGIPAFMIEVVLRSILSEVRMVAMKQYEEDRVQYTGTLIDVKRQEGIVENEIHE